MYKRNKKNSFVVSLRNSIQDAYKRGNIPRLNGLSVFLLEMIYENEQFRISNRHLDPQPIYTELNQLVDLYSQNLKMITKLEFMK